MTMQTHAGARQIGFTLIELMVTVAVVGIMAAIAYPQYTSYLQRGRILDATSKLSDYRIKMEQYFQDNRSYLNGVKCGIADPVTATNDSFSVKCDPAKASATGYTADAFGLAASNMANFQYELVVDTVAGLTKTTVKLPTSYGWKYPSPNNCWAIRKDGSCS